METIIALAILIGLFIWALLPFIIGAVAIYYAIRFISDPNTSDLVWTVIYAIITYVLWTW